MAGLPNLSWLAPPPPEKMEAALIKAPSLVCYSGISTESDCAFEPDYAVPPLPVSEGMQHIRIMEGMSRSLPSSPLLTHQSISVRLQPVKKLTAPLRKAKFVESPRIPESELGSPTLTSAQKLDVDAYCPDDAEAAGEVPRFENQLDYRATTSYLQV
ncbi:PREDICTED: protein TANC1-like, partial [Galeopterus variegatus]|uniref:Protein TANC1-like n=1 Tax=Galeopterus variegatus TaxID=482537 RepID=A0ABM0SG35_GALVR